MRTDHAKVQLKCSRSTLMRLKKGRHLHPKTHFIKIGRSRTSPILWNVVAIQQAMAQWTIKAEWK